MATKVKPKAERRNSSSKGTGKNRGSSDKCRCKSLKGLQLSPLSFLKQLADKVSRALHLVPMKKRHPREQPVSACADNSKPPVCNIDSHRTEAVEDCIKYINSSSSS